MRQLFNHFQNLLFPYRCVLCHEKAERRDVCDACYAELPHLKNACAQCALPLAGEGAQICGQCLQEPSGIDRSISCFLYEAPVPYFIAQFKFHQNLSYGRLLSDLLIERVSAVPLGALPDVLIPVPLHKTRLRERGYNQALELARPLAQHFNLALDFKNLQRIRPTVQQSLLPRSERRSNVSGAFEVVNPLERQHIGLVEDVMTTGYTVRECARVLKAAGAARVTLFSIARAA